MDTEHAIDTDTDTDTDTRYSNSTIEKNEEKIKDS